MFILISKLSHSDLHSRLASIMHFLINPINSPSLSQLPFQRVRAVLNYLMTIPVHTDDGKSMVDDRQLHQVTIYIQFSQCVLIHSC